MQEDRNKRIRYLEDLISRANSAYWNAQIDQLMEDSEYDRLVEELKTLDPNNSLITKMASDSVNDPTKVKHVAHMYSLDKVYEWEDLCVWAKSVARSRDELFIFTEKYDGCSVEIANGRLVTRGDGEYGNDITHLAPYIRFAFKLEVGMKCMTWAEVQDKIKGQRYVGELLITWGDFERLRNTFPVFREYKTPRTLAAGFMNMKPGNEVLQALTMNGNEPFPVATWILHTAHIMTVPLNRFNVYDIESTGATEVKDKIISSLRGWCGTPCDGIVCNLADKEYSDSLGFTMHHPKGWMAFKFVDEEYKAKVVGITWGVANEAITPVAEIEPTTINGRTFTRATCHNCKFITDNNLTVGATVTIVSRGDVIPKIIKVDPAIAKPGEPQTINPNLRAYPMPQVQIPSKCPSCGSETCYIEPDLVCINRLCPGRCTSKIIHGLNALGIQGIGPVTVEMLVRELHIPSIMAWIIETWDEPVLKAKGITAHMIHVITSEIERVVTSGVSDEDIIVSLCIPQVGEAFAKSVIKYVGGIIPLLEAFEKSPEDLKGRLLEIPRINSTAVKNFVDFFIEDSGSGEFEAYYNLFKHLRPGDAEKRPTYCLTGALPIPRREVERWIMSHGGMPTDNISHANYLVSASPVSNSTKMRYAREKGIPVITFDEMKAQLSK